MYKVQDGDIQYIKKLPENYSPNAQYPVLIFLHGAGSRGDDLENLITNPFFSYNKSDILNGIIYAPLCTEDTWFDMMERIHRFIDKVINRDDTDKNRVCLMGASMGGYAVWQLAMSCPDKFAAIVPICGGGMYWNAGRLKNMSIWAFHGREDNVVLCQESEKMVENVNRAGGNALLTIYNHTGHDCWNYVYDSEELFEWLSKCKNTIHSHENKYGSSELFG